jgi:hypothetical protein
LHNRFRVPFAPTLSAALTILSGAGPHLGRSNEVKEKANEPSAHECN